MNKYHSAMEKITVTPEMKQRILTNLSRKKEERNDKKNPMCFKWIKYASVFAVCTTVFFALLFETLKINFNLTNQQIQTIKLADNSEKNIVEHGELQVPKVPSNLGGTDNQSVGLQPQLPQSSGNSGENGTPAGGQQPKEPSSSGGDNTQSRNLPNQVPRSSNNSEVSGTKSEGQPISSDNSLENNAQADANPIVNTNGIDSLKRAVTFELIVPEKLPPKYKIHETSVISGELAQIIYSDGSSTITYRTAKGKNDISGDYNLYEESNTIEVGNAKVIIKGNKSLISLATWINNDCSYSLSFSIGIEKNAVISIIESMKKA